MPVKYGAPAGLGTVGLSINTIQALNSGAVGPTDVNVVYSEAVDWVDVDGASLDPILIPFTDLHTRIINSTAAPKEILVHFKSTQIASAVGLGCLDGDFKNVKIDLLGSGGIERSVIDESADSTPLKSRVYRFPEQYFNAVRITFVTNDPVCISNIVIKGDKPVSLSQRDYTTDSILTIDHSHEEIHAGAHYSYRDFYAIPRNATHDFLVVAPDTSDWCHFISTVEATSDILQVRFYEAPTYSAPGTLKVPHNRNRNFPDNAAMLIYDTPTMLTTGTLLFAYVLGSGRNSNGGQNRDAREIILRQGTAYLLRITEPNIAATTLNLEFDWYEHSNLNTL